MQAFTLSDLLELNSFNDNCACVVSADNNLIAFEIGRPIIQSVLGTTEYGAQHEEFDIYIADLTKENSARLLVTNTPDSAIQVQSYAPSWSPKGSYLAFILVEYQKTTDTLKLYEFSYSVAIWSKVTQQITKIAKVAAVNQHHRKQVFRWLNESELLIKSAKDKTTKSFDLLINPTERSLVQLYAARFNTKQTTSVYDNRAVLESASTCIELADALTETSLFDIHQPNQVLWSIDSTAYEYQFDVLVSPSKSSYLVPSQSTHPFKRANEDYFNTLSLGVIGEAGVKHRVEIAPYQTKLLNVLWSKNSTTIWVWLVHLEEHYACLGKIDYESGEWEAYTDTLFPYDVREYASILVEAEGQIYFSASLLDSNHTHEFDWFRFDSVSKAYFNLSTEFASVPEILFHCGGGVFLGCPQKQLARYEFAKQTVKQTLIFLGEDTTEPKAATIIYSLALLKRLYYKSRYIFEPAAPAAPCLIQKFTDDGFEYFLTADAQQFTPITLPDHARPLIVTHEALDSKVIALHTHLAGNDILAVSTENTQTLARFNTHLKHRQQAKTEFFTAGNEHDRSYCEMIFPVNADATTGYATVVCIYPSAQYRPHENTYAHNCDMQPIFNPHIFAAHGYGVLNLGLPLNPAKIQDTGILVELARIIEMALEQATSLGLINPDRLFIYGHSWGGYAASGVLAYLKIFKACIASAGIYNPMGEYGVFDIAVEVEAVVGESHSSGTAQVTVSSSLHPWEDPQHYIASSPLFLVPKIDTPILMLHGEQDFTVRCYPAQQMYTALMLQNKPVKLVTYGGEGHIISSRQNVEHAWDTMLKFLADYALN
ncbi:prolyl oligopeptidase family serine peptidase [uncultured Thiothrix sp.]|uniref:alpha/beta hydrolase family protein n=1 Tax=uncultured Thiothrix sp. TaxID=223185 RepID=UPI0026273DB9|nr:prolyl oligopeptidase family serine peptidase [uncultured Thiothrix sp.]